MKRISRTKYVRTAIEEKADLSAFKARPSFRVKLGIAVVLFSYAIGWPAVAVLGYFSVTHDRTWLIAIAAPLLYAFSHLVFVMGAYFSGADYLKVLLRWTVRVAMEKWMLRHPDES